jgi:hypothetical protein
MHRYIAPLLVLLASAPAHAQTAPATANTTAAIPPLKIVVTASRYDADNKRISSLPYTLSVVPQSGNAIASGRLRMGTQVPVPTTTPGKDGAAPSTGFTYRDVGTNIDLVVRKFDDGAFLVQISFEDSSVFAGDERQQRMVAGQVLAPTIRSFSLSNQVVLKDAQTAQFNTTPDKVTGEILKLDISLTVLK